MIKRMKNQLTRNQRGITGLETAIILIAFVVVASVFAYTVLSAGIFSAEKGKEAIYEGLEGARSSLTLVGGVIAKDVDGDNDLDLLLFTVTNALAGEAIDFNVTTDTDFDGLLSDEASKNHTTIISYHDSTQEVSDVAWTKAELGKGDGDPLLEVGEKFTITLYLGSALATDPDEYDQFTIEIKPDGGAALIFERTLPAVIDDVMDLR